MMQLCLLICANGLGHARRAIQVVATLLETSGEVSATIACSSRQVDALVHWPILQRLKENPAARFLFLEPYPHWTLDSVYYRDNRLMTWHEKLKPLDLGSFDLVLSDNLVEPLHYQPRTILMGSFLWHDVYRTQFPKEPLVGRYADRCDALLQEHKPAMIVNRYFVMPGVREKVRALEVGMLPPVVKDGVKRTSGVPGVLFAGGATGTGMQHLRGCLEDMEAGVKLDGRVKLFVERGMAMRVSSRDGWSVFDYDRDDFGQIHAVVARPGMGMITDCVGTGTPMFCVHETNPEMDHNAMTLERLGLGWNLAPAEGCFKQVGAFLQNRDAQMQYRQHVVAMDRSGLETTVRYLISSLR